DSIETPFCALFHLQQASRKAASYAGATGEAGAQAAIACHAVSGRGVQNLFLCFRRKIWVRSQRQKYSLFEDFSREFTFQPGGLCLQNGVTCSCLPSSWRSFLSSGSLVSLASKRLKVRP